MSSYNYNDIFLACNANLKYTSMVFVRSTYFRECVEKLLKTSATSSHKWGLGGDFKHLPGTLMLYKA